MALLPVIENLKLTKFGIFTPCVRTVCDLVKKSTKVLLHQLI